MDGCDDFEMEILTRVKFRSAFSLLLLFFQAGCESPRVSSGVGDSSRTGGIIQTEKLPREGFFEGSSLKILSLDDVVARVKPGGVLIISEQHGNQKHYAHQKLALEALAKTANCTVSVGLEFLSWNHQDVIDQYFDGKLIEQEFLKQVEWGGNPFADYRDQALSPKLTAGRLVGINAPKKLTSSIAKSGIENLSSDEVKDMPPLFELGTAVYRERFEVVMGQHVPPNALDRYFAAQSVWDDSMAWQAKEFLNRNPAHCLAVIVGDFHAAWGGGLPDRMSKRGISNVTVISQIETRDLSENELSSELGPHPKYGVRADGVWLSEASQATP